MMKAQQADPALLKPAQIVRVVVHTNVKTLKNLSVLYLVYN